MHRTPAIAVISAAAALIGCSGDDAQPVEATGPTYHADVAQLLQKSCLTCHSEGRIAPFSLDTYEAAKGLAASIAVETQARRMPPFGAQETAECEQRYPIEHDIRLSEAEIATLKQWADNGAPEGDPAASPPPYMQPPEGLASVDLELAPKAPFVTSGTADQFRCFVLDPMLSGKRFIDGMAVRPGNPAVVHHALTYRAARADFEGVADENGMFECFGAPSGDLVHAWAPGAVPVELPDGIAVPIEAEDVLVMQIHYHPTGPAADPDATRFQLHFAEEEPEYQLLIGLIGNADDEGDGLLPGEDDQGGVEFRIPAGKKTHVETIEYRVPFLGVDHAKMYSVATHMHYVGRDMKVEIERLSPDDGEPGDECLLQTPDWNFNWQRFYAFDVPIDSLPRARAGDVIRLRCTYDNTLDNGFVMRALAEQGIPTPIDVRLGESTVDEMCLFPLGFLVPSALMP